MARLYSGSVNATSVTGTVNGNTLTTGSSTYTGTAGQTYTFPSTSATIARTDAANSFTGTQTFGNVTATGQVGIGGGPGADTKLALLSTYPTSGNITYVTKASGTIPSGTTTGAVIFQSVPTTQAAVFTMGSLWHFQAVQGTIGAGSAITTQYGFNADNTLTGATNNYGFYSDLAAASNRWNFYGNGTARSLLNGDLTIFGSTAPPAGGTAGTGLMMSSTANLGIFFGSGVPSLSAAQGSLYIRTDGSSISTRLYINTNGSTGWTNVTTLG